MTKYPCPVCEINSLREPYKPYSYDICLMCGVEFGYEDSGTSHEELRKVWKNAGCPNWHQETKKPDFKGGVKWFDDYFSEEENEKRREESLLSIFKKCDG